MKINNREWKVKYDTEILKIDPCIKGLTSFEESTIYLKPGMSKAYADATLMHEIVHAYIDSYGFSYQKTFTHEQLCEWVSSYIFMITNTFKEAKKELGKEPKVKKVVRVKKEDDEFVDEVELELDEDFAKELNKKR